MTVWQRGEERGGEEKNKELTQSTVSFLLVWVISAVVVGTSVLGCGSPRTGRLDSVVRGPIRCSV